MDTQKEGLMGSQDRPYQSWELVLHYMRYRWRALNGKGHGIHSPFVFAFVRDVLNEQPTDAFLEQVFQLKKELLQNHTRIEVLDFGAGSVKGNRKSKKISEIAATASKPPKMARLLYRMAQVYQPDYVLELGTSLGLSTALLSRQGKARVVSIEGDPGIADLARKHMAFLGLPQVQILTGEIDQQLPEAMASLPQIDLVFMDGNHRYQATCDYFDQLLPHLTPNSLVIVDDIHWSAGMRAAWDQIRQHPSVTLSIDLFFIGILCFRPDIKVKQDFVIRY
jgi:predicted O-methyltransferase YrrM